MAWTAARITAEIERCKEWGVVLEGKQELLLGIFQCWLEVAGLDQGGEYSEGIIIDMITGMRQEIAEEVFDRFESKRGLQKAKIKARIVERRGGQRHQDSAATGENSVNDFLGLTRKAAEIGAKVFFRAKEIEYEECSIDDQSHDEEGLSDD